MRLAAALVFLGLTACVEKTDEPGITDEIVAICTSDAGSMGGMGGAMDGAARPEFCSSADAGHGAGDSGMHPDGGGMHPDGGGMLPDSGGMLPDSGGMLPDTGGMLPDTGGMLPDGGM
jgi:hypothetical protein